MELDPANQTLYQAEIQRWKREEQRWSARQDQDFSNWERQVEERKRKEKEREERRAADYFGETPKEAGIIRKKNRRTAPE